MVLIHHDLEKNFVCVMVYVQTRVKTQMYASQRRLYAKYSHAKLDAGQAEEETFRAPRARLRKSFDVEAGVAHGVAHGVARLEVPYELIDVLDDICTAIEYGNVLAGLIIICSSCYVIMNILA